MLNLVKSSLKIGVEKPIKLLHVTDTHISDTDERDDERKRCICQNFDSEYIKNLRNSLHTCGKSATGSFLKSSGVSIFDNNG